jgi:hypothetical protein
MKRKLATRSFELVQQAEASSPRLSLADDV